MALDPRAILYSKEMSPLEFNFETLCAPSMYNWLDYNDIQQLNYIANSVKLSSDVQKKKYMIKQIMERKGCHKIGGGTNRIVYAPYECNTICFKVALDSIGIKANQLEYNNQHYLKPFITKMFELDPTCVIGSYERIKAIQSIQEFESVAEDVYELLVNNILGKYVMEDIGSEYPFNYGVRIGFGVVLLDYAMMFKLDGSKLYCNNIVNGMECGGEIDYDDGFNHLYCTKCGLHYQARKLSSSIQQNKIKIMKEENDMSLVSQLIIGGKVVLQSDNSTETIQDQSEVKGVIKTRKVKMTPQEIKRYEKEQRKKHKHEQNTKHEVKEDISTGVITDNRQQTLGDVVGEALKEILEEDKNKKSVSELNQEMKTFAKENKLTHVDLNEAGIKNIVVHKESNSGENEYFKQDGEIHSEQYFSPEQLQQSLMEGNKDEEEPDYSSYGLEETSDEEVIEEHEESNQNDQTDSMKNFEPIKKQKRNKIDNL